MNTTRTKRRTPSSAGPTLRVNRIYDRSLPSG